MNGHGDRSGPLLSFIGLTGLPLSLSSEWLVGWSESGVKNFFRDSNL